VARARSVYRCAECGHEHPKWAGRCEGCGAWNTVSEEPVATNVSRKTGARAGGGAGRAAFAGTAVAARLRDVAAEPLERLRTGIDELDFVLGGGIVPGSMTLIGGEPGIGKSTLLLQAAARLEAGGRTVLYASGEESPDQLRLRADRLEEDAGAVHVLGETRLEAIVEAARRVRAEVVVLDSIQTVYTELLESAPGNVGQVRECAARLMRFAKDSGTAVFVVGHVTKGGGIAGPKTLEHIVDTVLYFEGEGFLDQRVLRATKNRFGGVDEIGVFRMTAGGLIPVPNPSELFLGERHSGASGTAVTALMEGTRPLLVEVQGLAAKAGFGTPQRVATGYDGRRLALLLAVLDKRAGLSFAQLDVFVNVVGGLKVQEPAGDLAIAAALASSVYDRALPPDAVLLGEIGLAGEIRPVSQAERRLAEAEKMGMGTAFLAERSIPRRAPKGLKCVGVQTVRELLDRLFP
jgi:DNA repair protein RadA/Sms